MAQMTILRHARRVDYETHTLCFDYLDTPGLSIGFPCDEYGIPSGQMTELRLTQLRNARLGHVAGRQVGKGYVQTMRRHRIQPAVGLCTCTAHVVLSEPVTTCHRCHTQWDQEGKRVSVVQRARRAWERFKVRTLLPAFGLGEGAAPEGMHIAVDAGPVECWLARHLGTQVQGRDDGHTVTAHLWRGRIYVS